MKRLALTLAIVMALAFLLTACGGDLNPSGYTYESSDGVTVRFTDSRVTFTADGQTHNFEYTINSNRNQITMSYSGLLGDILGYLGLNFGEGSVSYSITRNSVTIDGVTYTRK
jgi:hypothetical protein